MPGLIKSATRTLLSQARLFGSLQNSKAGIFLFFSLLWGLASCKSQEKPDQNREEIIRQFKSGSLGFLLEADPAEVRELAKIEPSGAFYAGLAVRTKERAEPSDLSLILFQEALESPAPRIRSAAAQELIAPVLTKAVSPTAFSGLAQKIPPENPRNNPLITLRSAVLYASGLYAEIPGTAEIQKEPSPWDTALALTAALRLQQQGPNRERTAPEKNILRGKLLGFLLAGTPDRAYTWAFREITQQDPDFFGTAESAAVLGRFAVADSAYQEAFRQFKTALEEDQTIFFQYPDLTGDLGRTFQYISDDKAQTEGVKLFIEWEKGFQTGAPIPESVSRGNPAVEADQIRFRILYFLGRIERRRRNYPQSAVYFKSSLPFAPDPIQEDAAIWYILDVLRSIKPENLLSGVHTYLERRHDPAYFSDILDHLCRYLTVNRRWSDMLNVFPLIRFFADGSTMAKYAYILGRAAAENYISPEEAAEALCAGDMGSLSSPEERKTAIIRTFFRIAFEEANASFYYRAMSAAKLGDAVTFSAGAVAGSSADSVSGAAEAPHFSDKEEMEFLLGFFEYRAGAHSFSYIKSAQDRLSALELRAIAQALTDGGFWLEAIRLVNAYILREDYTVSPEDMRLYYPRAYSGIIEKNAADLGIPPEMLYGLIRTESAFDAGIQSHAGAVGLTQLMPATAKEEAERIRKRGGPNYADALDLRDPNMNVHIGASYLAFLLHLMKSPMQALLSYNGGYNRVRQWRAGEPKFPEDLFLETLEFLETREYGKRVLGAAAAYGYLYFDMTMEAVAADIFK
ncbi:MAG: lytic transglycosylase domain-containing protein [Spirochaetaceae bacterium]|nr:lytic transglycosylase domain-containing protein [Spirochaetaceae bacterium]